MRERKVEGSAILRRVKVRGNILRHGRGGKKNEYWDVQEKGREIRTAGFYSLQRKLRGGEY